MKDAFIITIEHLIRKMPPNVLNKTSNNVFFSHRFPLLKVIIIKIPRLLVTYSLFSRQVFLPIPTFVVYHITWLGHSGGLP